MARLSWSYEKFDTKLTHTLVRKSFVSKGNSEVSGSKKELSNMMWHSEKIANELYLLEDKVRNVSSTFTIMNSIMPANDDDHVMDSEMSDSSKEILKKMHIVRMGNLELR